MESKSTVHPLVSDGKQIFSLLPLIMEDLGAIKKGRKNPKGYKFRGVEDVLNSLHPVLIKHRVSLSQQTTNLRTETIEEAATGGPTKIKRIYRSFLEVTVTFYAPDGSSVSNTAAGEGIDYNDDKATSKAMSTAFKYAIFLGLCVPVEDGELNDSDGSGSGSGHSEGGNSGPPVSQGGAVISSPGDTNGSPATSTMAAPLVAPQSNVMTDNGPCHQGQQDQIMTLVSRIGEAKNWQSQQSIDWLKAMLAKNGKQRRSDLTYAEAVSLISFLEATRTKAEMEMLVGNTTAAGKPPF